MTALVTPYLPKEATSAIQAHEQMNKLPAFVLAYERPDVSNACPNCQGIGVVMVRLAKAGPFASPAAGPQTVVTWYDGGDKFRKGFYLVDKTLCFPCPKCKGQAPELGEFVPGPGPLQSMAELAKMFEGRKKR